jgi:hypothetical protein
MHHWLMRIGDGEGFTNSKKFNIWALKSWASDGKNFLSDATKGDIIWLLTNYTKGRKLVGVATFVSTNKREVGPLIAVTKTNEELGWGDGTWDTEIHYENLYEIDILDLYPDVKHQSSIVKTSSITTHIDFELEYKNIVKYSKIKLSCGFK